MKSKADAMKFTEALGYKGKSIRDAVLISTPQTASYGSYKQTIRMDFKPSEWGHADLTSTGAPSEPQTEVTAESLLDLARTLTSFNESPFYEFLERLGANLERGDLIVLPKIHRLFYDTLIESSAMPDKFKTMFRLDVTGAVEKIMIVNGMWLKSIKMKPLSNDRRNKHGVKII